jgi:hypothetical protein
MSAAPFPSREEVDWSAFSAFEDEPHPLVNNSWCPPDPDDYHAREMFFTMRNVHHLLDMAGVPHGYSMDTQGIDCRVYLLVLAFLKATRA